jgi:hypothetical protein
MSKKKPLKIEDMPIIETSSKTIMNLYNQGYDQALKDALYTITKILSDNDITMEEKEFWKEYRLLKKEGVLK